jgi:hypothetical protein
MPRLMLKPILKIGSIIAFLGALALYLWWTQRVPPPHEHNRVTHRDGAFSIIRPPDWEVSFNYSPTDPNYIDTLEIRAPTTRPRDRRIFIGRLRQAPDHAQAAGKLVATQFQGQPARVYKGNSRLEFYWRTVFERGGQWYELVLWLPLEENVPQTGWWAYLQTFSAGTPATTEPSLAR